MRMEPRLEMKPELRQEQRLKLEARIEARLEQQMVMEMTLAQYLEQEDLVRKFIEWADEHKAWKKFDRDSFDFTFGELPYKIAKPIADVAGLGFAHCMYNPFEALFFGKKVALAKGNWVLFIVEDKIPTDLKDFVAIHERGEEISLGDHYFSSQLEFALTKKRNSVMDYVRFVDRESPEKFTDLTQKVNFPILPQELIGFLTEQGKRSELELERAEQLIEKYPLPYIVLRKIVRYREITDNVCELLREKAGRTQYTVSKLYKPLDGIYPTPEELADAVDRVLSETLRAIRENEARVASRNRVNEQMQFFERLVGDEAYKITERHLRIPTDFDKAYKDAKEGKRLVSVRYTPEDRKRQEREKPGE